MPNMNVVTGLFTMLGLLFSLAANAQGQQNYYPYGSYPQTQNAQQLANKNRAFSEWSNWMKNQMNGKNWQQGDGNIFQDAKGFYKLLGNGNTKWKFYFNFDFDVEMDAWLKAQQRAKANKRLNQNLNQRYNQQQYWNHQGQAAPGYRYHGQGYYQGYVYPQQAYPYQPYPVPYGQQVPLR